MKTIRSLLAVLLLCASPGVAWAQFGVGGPPAGPPPSQQSAPKDPNAPEMHAASGTDADERLRTQNPTMPADPLEISPEMKKRIGTNFDYEKLELGKTALTTRLFIPPYYEEKSGQFRFRTVFPFWFERQQENDRASLFGLFYYNRRSPKHDADVLFPFFWNVRNDTTRTTVIGPYMHRERESKAGKGGRHDNWLVPFLFEGGNDEGSSYLHVPPLLTFTKQSPRGGYNVVGPMYCFWSGGPNCDARTADSIDLGLAPFYFYGRDEKREYEIIPPLLHYYRYNEATDSATNVWGPLWWERSPESNVFNILPFYWHSWGKNEETTTLFPFFHHSQKGRENLLITPLFVSAEGEHGESTFATWGYARYRGRTEFDMITPFYYNYRDPDARIERTLIPPFYYRNTSPRDDDFALFPFYGHFQRKGLRESHWITPLFEYKRDTEGWETNLYPFFFMGQKNDSSHLVLAPFVWDFASSTSRTTVVMPVFYRSSDENSVTQLALNTYYSEKKVRGGKEWEFHFFPLFSYGQSPGGHWWNLMYGLAGFTRQGTMTKVRAFYVPITLSN